MALILDREKNERNIRERGLSFELAAEIEWDTALVREDTRHDYSETRQFVLGTIRGRLHAMVVTPRGEDLRVISLRKAKQKEQILYEQRKDRPRTH